MQLHTASIFRAQLAYIAQIYSTPNGWLPVGVLLLRPEASWTQFVFC
jgi:hypothetical protein